ncbi:MAG: nucleotidyl transferase AbiEii/AbiGii toxin family protein [Desulfobacterales bacterium]|nr:nucleotidyl transferase AbiEii/AbiGii toxin family protein [Desulfobacterales bacterium]
MKLKKFKPLLDILPEPQRNLWHELAKIPRHFVLYGGTAIALRLGHRKSVDFDFFSPEPLNEDCLFNEFKPLVNAQIIQREVDTLSVIIDRNGFVKLSFFCNLKMGNVEPPEFTYDETILVASKVDLLAHKLKVILQRAESKDYRDISALIQSGVQLSEGISASLALWKNFPAMESLRALTFFKDGDLYSLPQSDRKVLISAASDFEL